MNKGNKVLISGAGIAGPTLAYWLSRYGFNPTLIERAPALRTGGFVMDFWGGGFRCGGTHATRPATRAGGLQSA
jgi:2-polyprenyl-6-methoxyphenol hydroxylase-like FAD-dependent oxidoreductase